jgi:hypothetical protein
MFCLCHCPFVCVSGAILRLVLEQLSATPFPEQFVGTAKGTRASPERSFLEHHHCFDLLHNFLTQFTFDLDKKGADELFLYFRVLVTLS